MKCFNRKQGQGKFTNTPTANWGKERKEKQRPSKYERQGRQMTDMMCINEGDY
jgi:hypothetical protein